MIVTLIILLSFNSFESLLNKEPEIISLSFNCNTWFYEDYPELLNHTCVAEAFEITYQTSLSLMSKQNMLIINHDTIKVNSDYDIESFKYYRVIVENDTFFLFQCLKSKYSGSLLDNYDYYLFSIKMNKLNCYSFVESEQNLELTVNQLLAKICN